MERESEVAGVVLDRLFAAAYDPVTRLAEPRFRPHRRYLAEDLDGRVLDLGCGTGRQLPAFAEWGGDLEIVGLDPDPHMLKRARLRAVGLDLDVSLDEGYGESLPYPDGHFDAVVAPMVLCSVDDPEAVLSEVERVLRPGGQFRLFEHVHADGTWGRIQRAVQPLWGPVAGGCHLTRRSGSLAASRPGLDVLELEQIDPGFPLVRPFVRGRFAKRR